MFAVDRNTIGGRIFYQFRLSREMNKKFPDKAPTQQFITCDCLNIHFI